MVVGGDGDEDQQVPLALQRTRERSPEKVKFELPRAPPALGRTSPSTGGESEDEKAALLGAKPKPPARKGALKGALRKKAVAGVFAQHLSKHVTTKYDSQLRKLRFVIYPTAARLTHLFGFQREALDKFVCPRAAGEAVPSNLDNQVDHMIMLLFNEMTRHPGETYTEVLHHAVSKIHHQIFANYARWLSHVGLETQAATAASDSKFGKKAGRSLSGHTNFGALSQSDTWMFLGPWEFLTIEEEHEWVFSAHLHQLMLYFKY